MNKKITRGLLFFGIVAFFYACQNQDNRGQQSIAEENDQRYFEIRGNTQGTTFYIKYFGQELKGTPDSINYILKEIDRCFSLWRDDSEIVRMNESNGVYKVYDPKNYFREVFDYSKEIHGYTDGAFNPALHPLISAWGFSRKKGIEPSRNKIDSLLPLSNFNDWKYLSLSKGEKRGEIQLGKGSLDFNAIAQGYTVDVLGRFFKRNEVDNFFIEVGGETLTGGLKSGDNKWVVAIDKPLENLSERSAQDTVYLTDKALVTSGSYRKFVEIDGKKYSHTINPVTGFPSGNHLLSVSVIMGDCAGADAYATAFMVMGKEKTIASLSHLTFIEGVYLIYEENGELKTFVSEGFKPYLAP